MNPSDRSDRSGSTFTRRQFLVGLGAALSWAAAACGGRFRSTLSAPSALPSPATPTTVPSPAPTLTPVPAVDPADMVLRGGRVITVDPGETIAQALAVRRGRIAAVGTDEEIDRYVGAATEVVDLAGRAVTPGLVDAHNHLQVLGLLNGYYRPFLPPDVVSISDLQEALAEVVARTPAGQWIIGYFMSVGERLPNRYDIDPVSPNHPVFLVQQGGHYGSANSVALAEAGISAATPDPVGGVIGRDEQSRPDGVFYNHRAMDLVKRVMPLPTPEMARANIRAAQESFAAGGVTTFHDNNVRGLEAVQAYIDVAREGGLYLRGRIYYTLEWPGDVDRALNEIEPYQDEFLTFAGYKFLLDGQALMAYCHEPHNGERWDTPTWEPATFRDAARLLHETGRQICVHCVGDAAMDLTLDAYQEAQTAHPRPDPRHRVEHAVITRAESTRRLVDLGVVVSTQPQFIRLLRSRDAYVQLFGEERVSRLMVTREWLDAGVPLALGSDAPTTPWLTPQPTLFGAVRRVNFSEEVMGPEQVLTVQEALRAHTVGSAYAGFQEAELGSIEVGKLADLAVWAEDPTTAPVRQLWQIPVDLTIVGGRVVYPR